MAKNNLFKTKLVLFIYFFYCFGNFAQFEAAPPPFSLWYKLVGVKEKQVLEDDLLHNWLLFPEYHGYETKGEDMWNEPFVPQKDCNYEIENITAGTYGSVKSPNYPDNYPPGLQCQWTIQSPPGTVIRATFFDMVTQPWFFFYYDYLLVSLDGNWNQFYRFTGDMNRLAPISIESKGNKLAVRFASSFDFFNYRGFKMVYVVKAKDITSENEMSSNIDTTTTNSTNILQNGDGNDLTAICDYVPIPLPTDSSGDIPLKKVNTSRIVGGSEALPHEYPFIVALLIDDNNFCGGSLIDERYVLTAAHCTQSAKKLELYFGVHDMNANEDTRQYQLVSPDNVYQHPKYNKLTAAHDIAVIRLNERIKPNGNAYVQPLYLPSVYSLGNSFNGWNLTTMGWGDNNKTLEGEEGGIYPVLKKTTATVIANEECRKSYRSLVTGNFICSKGSLTDSPCAGDSGGPLVAKFIRKGNTVNDVPAEVSNDQVHQCVFSKSHRSRVNQEKGQQPGNEVSEWFVQLGLLSFGSRACGSGQPAAYTRITAYMDFISPILEQENFRKIA